MKTILHNARVHLRLTLNGKAISGMAEPRMLLCDFLRNVLGATGTHVGCEHGVCGCCTVIMDGAATRSCLTLAVQADQSSIETVESLAGTDGALNPLQAAFKEHHALQCGFCTAGILMSFTDFLRREPKPTREQVIDVLSGHLCRCTGYTDIVEAVMAAVNAPAAAYANLREGEGS
jgi:2-furoyl-CoA dehydrogenase 2Fe-2S iron sulfur subunit